MDLEVYDKESKKSGLVNRYYLNIEIDYEEYFVPFNAVKVQDVTDEVVEEVIM